MSTKAVDLEVGTMVDRWRVDGKLGQGGFGAVYRVIGPSGSHFALKAECASDDVQILKTEIAVLTALQKRNCKHFCKIEDKGRWKSVLYMVMSLVGKSLRDLRKAQPSDHFSMGTALGVGIQALDALEELHSTGFVHRDVKPGNLTIGCLESDIRNLYILDFGMCRRYTERNMTNMSASYSLAFRGTARYAALASHHCCTASRKDDLESWVYMQVEFTNGRLPWKNMENLNEIRELKKKCRKEPALSAMLEGCAPEMKEIVQMVVRTQYYEKPPYRRLRWLMRQSFTSTHTQELPYDWEKSAGGLS